MSVLGRRAAHPLELGVRPPRRDRLPAPAACRTDGHRGRGRVRHLAPARDLGHRHRWIVAAPVTAVAGLLYTIPSLALFALLMPHHGPLVPDGRGRPGQLHAAHLDPQRRRRPLRRAGGREGRGARHGLQLAADAVASGASPRDAGDRGGDPRGHRQHDRPGDGRWLDRPRRAWASSSSRAWPSSSTRRSSSAPS